MFLFSLAYPLAAPLSPVAAVLDTHAGDGHAGNETLISKQDTKAVAKICPTSPCVFVGFAKTGSESLALLLGGYHEEDLAAEAVFMVDLLKKHGTAPVKEAMMINAPRSAARDEMDKFVWAREGKLHRPDVTTFNWLFAGSFARVFPESSIFAAHRPFVSWLDSFVTYDLPGGGNDSSKISDKDKLEGFALIFALMPAKPDPYSSPTSFIEGLTGLWCQHEGLVLGKLRDEHKHFHDVTETEMATAPVNKQDLATYRLDLWERPELIRAARNTMQRDSHCRNLIGYSGEQLGTKPEASDPYWTRTVMATEDVLAFYKNGHRFEESSSARR